MWVPLVENGEYDSPGADYFVQQHIDRLMAQSLDIDTILLACTHYPLIRKEVEDFYKGKIKIYDNAEVVAKKVAAVLKAKKLLAIKKSGEHRFFVSDYTKSFEESSRYFFPSKIKLAEAAIWM